MTCKDCLHPKICFGPEGVDEKSITYCADAKKCISFEPKCTPCALFPLHASIYDSYYGKPRRWIVESIGIQLRKGVPYIQMVIVCTSHSGIPRRVILASDIGKVFFTNEELTEPSAPMLMDYPVII